LNEIVRKDKSKNVVLVNDRLTGCLNYKCIEVENDVGNSGQSI
jgi:hypothetical protein